MTGLRCASSVRSLCRKVIWRSRQMLLQHAPREFIHNKARIASTLSVIVSSAIFKSLIMPFYPAIPTLLSDPIHWDAKLLLFSPDLKYNFVEVPGRRNEFSVFA